MPLPSFLRTFVFPVSVAALLATTAGAQRLPADSARTRSVVPQGAVSDDDSAWRDGDEPDQRAFMLKSARTAWAFVVRARTNAGFVGATDNYPYMTVWDMASTIAATWSARELGIISPAQYHAEVDLALRTIERMSLYDGAAFNKQYAARDGAMVNRKNESSTRGYGWSVLDHGRLLVWLNLIGRDDAGFAVRTQAIVGRLNMARLVNGGYLHGEDLDPQTSRTRSYQEGRVGYEQYAAEGFALWGTRADSALDFSVNGKPVTVNGQAILADRRGNDLMTSEPFVMMGLELGWTSPTWRSLALAVLAAQEARYRATGVVTMISEDAIPVAPAYFYYYLLYREGKSFVVTTPAGEEGRDFPRWVSAKAAFGYHALAPSDYTWRALQAVKWGSAPGRGWTAGVFEGTHQATKTFNLNTAAIVLESAAYAGRGCAFAQRTCSAAPQH